MTQVDLLDGALGHAYVIIHVSSSPADFGWSFIRRPRLFSILIRRRRSTMLADFRTIYQHICDSLATQIRSLTVASVFTASPSELLDAENRARMKHKLEPVLCGLGISSHANAAWIPGSIHVDVEERDWQRAISWRRMPLWSISKPSFSQDVERGEQANPNLRHAGNILWSPKHGRWILASELALAMGFPVNKKSAEAAQCEQDAAWYFLVSCVFFLKAPAFERPGLRWLSIIVFAASFFSYHGVLLWFLQRLLSFLDPAAKWGDFRCFGPILRLGKCNSCYPSWAVALGTAKQCWGMWQLARSSHELNWWIHISWTPKMSCSSR